MSEKPTSVDNVHVNDVERNNSDDKSKQSGCSSCPAKEAHVDVVEITAESTEVPSTVTDLETGASNPHVNKKIGWIKLTVLLIVEAIALGTLGMPSAFAALGMITGTIMTVMFGLISVYAAYIVGKVTLEYPQVKSFPDLGTLLLGNTGYWFVSGMFCCTLTLLVGGHVLACTQAFNKLVNKPEICSVFWGIIAGFLLFVLALPKNFKDFAPLGYIDFGSIVIAVGVIIIAGGVIANKTPGGLSAVDWSYGSTDQPFYKLVLAAMNIIFAYSFIMVQPAMMREMREPKVYMKSIWTLAIVEIIIYTVVGAVSYAFIGQDVQSPVLLSSSPMVVRVAFGLALPVIIISGSINTIVVGKFIQETKLFRRIKITQSSDRWTKHAVWAALVLAITIIAWIVAEAIPFFSALLGLIASLFISGFSFYIPGLLWFTKLRVGRWNSGWTNIFLSVVNAALILLGVTILGVGAYASITEINTNYATGAVKRPFSCATAY